MSFIILFDDFGVPEPTHPFWAFHRQVLPTEWRLDPSEGELFLVLDVAHGRTIAVTKEPFDNGAVRMSIM